MRLKSKDEIQFMREIEEKDILLPRSGEKKIPISGDGFQPDFVYTSSISNRLIAT
jgi:hypothetical protein